MVFVHIFNYYKNKTAINGGYYLKSLEDEINNGVSDVVN